MAIAFGQFRSGPSNQSVQQAIGTLIAQRMAAARGVRAVRTDRTGIAGASVVEFPIGLVRSIRVGVLRSKMSKWRDPNKWKLVRSIAISLAITMSKSKKMLYNFMFADSEPNRKPIFVQLL
ncbi:MULTISPECIES: hypothetical protein [unclassified Microcoleus]|uniref:hypothetical protein n=1 Tax=unclassified Microcoleus TaxID=2642155 RepID=UPI002FCEE619